MFGILCLVRYSALTVLINEQIVRSPTITAPPYTNICINQYRINRLIIDAKGQMMILCQPSIPRRNSIK